MFKQSLYRDRKVILPVLRIYTTITGIVNSVLKYAEIESKKGKFRKKDSEINNRKDRDYIGDYTH